MIYSYIIYMKHHEASNIITNIITKMKDQTLKPSCSLKKKMPPSARSATTISGSTGL